MGCARPARGRWRLLLSALALSGLLGAAAPPPAFAQERAPAERLKIVGGLAGLPQYVDHEEPFWTRDLPRLSQGRFKAEIVPFDRAGLRATDLLSLVQLGSVPFGTVLLAVAAGRDPELGAPDLAGLNPDMATLRRTLAAYRPTLAALLRERYGVELLAIYAYPAQVLFCKQPWQRLDDLQGRRIRTSSVSQSDWVEALGGRPVSTPFAEIASNLRGGNIDCAITGTMSGHRLGLHELTSHLHGMAVNWGLSAFVANGAAWQALPAELRQLLQRELPRLEAAIWDEAERDTRLGIECNTGARSCGEPTRGRMTEVPTRPEDLRRQREIFAGTVLPRWAQRCGAECAIDWNRTLGAVSGVSVPPLRSAAR